jgi:hypothetical protein
MPSRGTWVQLASGVMPPCPTSADSLSPAFVSGAISSKSHRSVLTSAIAFAHVAAGFQAIQKIDIFHRQIVDHVMKLGFHPGNSS